MTTEKRYQKRIPVRIPAGVYRKDKPHEAIDAEILDISVGGAFVHCTAEVPVGIEILLEIRFSETHLVEGTVVELEENLTEDLPDDSKEKSIIRWSRKADRPGFGVEFVSLQPDKQRFVARLVQYFEQLEKAGACFE